MNRRHLAWSATSVLFSFSAVFSLSLGSGAYGAQNLGSARVKSEISEVHAEMSKESKVVLSLKKGEPVTVRFDVRSSGACWSKIKVATSTQESGYVLCSDLDRPPEREEQWSMIPQAEAKPEAKAEAPATDWSKSPLAAEVRELCPEIEESHLKYGWPLKEVAYSIAVNRCFEIAYGVHGRKLRAAEISAWQSKAEKRGIQACWERYLANRAQHRGSERDDWKPLPRRASPPGWEDMPGRNGDPCFQRMDEFYEAILATVRP